MTNPAVPADIESRWRPLTTTETDGDLALLVRQRRHVEQLGNALPSFDLAQQHALAGVGQRRCKRGGYRRLAGAAFARNDVEGGREGHALNLSRKHEVGGPACAAGRPGATGGHTFNTVGL